MIKKGFFVINIMIQKIKGIFNNIHLKKPLFAHSVKYAYGDQQVLKNITLGIKEGKITSIIGKSGSGKSTFLKLIAGIISNKYDGKILIFGKSRFFKKSKLGFVSQDLAFIPDLSILDNIKICGLNYGISEERAVKKAKELMKLLRLEEKLEKKPTNLSGGQKVRLHIILPLLHNPRIIVMDEPFVGLDFSNRRLLWHFIESMKKSRKSIVLTSHLLTETQEHADKLVILKDGKIFFNGNLESLKNKLKIKFIFEVRFSYLSASNLKEIKKYCDYREIDILEKYQNFMMFGIRSTKTRSALINLLEKLKLIYQEVGFREPNLDEIFLKA